MEVEEQAELMVEVKRGNNLQVQTNKCVKIRVINWDLNDCKLIIWPFKFTEKSPVYTPAHEEDDLTNHSGEEFEEESEDGLEDNLEFELQPQSEPEIALETHTGEAPVYTPAGEERELEAEPELSKSPVERARRGD